MFHIHIIWFWFVFFLHNFRADSHEKGQSGAIDRRAHGSIHQIHQHGEVFKRRGCAKLGHSCLSILNTFKDGIPSELSIFIKPSSKLSGRRERLDRFRRIDQAGPRAERVEGFPGRSIGGGFRSMLPDGSRDLSLTAERVKCICGVCLCDGREAARRRGGPRTV